MNQKTKKILKIVAPILLGVVLLLYLFHSTSPEQRKNIYFYILNADYKWVAISLIFGTLSHLSRAYRWKFLLEPLGYKPKFANSFMAVMAAYFANLGVPRSGEVLRATTITAYEGIPFEKAFGTIVAERIADLIMSFIIIGIALCVQYDVIIEAIQKKIPENPFALLVIGLALTFLAFLAHKLFRKSEHKLIVKIRNFIDGLKEGMISIFKMKQKWAFIFHTFFIWFMYVMMFYVIFFSVEETKDASLSAVLSSFITGSFAVATTNGGFLAYPLAIEKTLVLYGLPGEPSQAIGWIMWSGHTLLTIIFGALSFFFLPIFNRKK
ncbi:MAG: flippase-like domain-containing protein [Flavobacteriaceae bacterium]|nr:flippase-like domain-containing protein [Flavobacteriaceae bacterium]